jgi:hypothetical protein
MTDLTDARAALAELLNTIPGMRAVTEVPKTFTPPIVWVAAGAPYRQRAQAIGKKRINLVAVCFGGMSTNDATDAATEALAEKVADLIDVSGHVSPYFRLDPLAEMDQPRLYPSAQGQPMLGIVVNLFCESHRG